MLTAARIKEIKSLQLAKFRKELGQFVLEGDKMVRESLNQQRIARIGVYATEAWKASVRTEFPHAVWSEITVVREQQLHAASGMKTPQQALAVLQIPASTMPKLAEKAIYLDGIQDPGNVGTILRLADWFGITQVFASESTADFYSPKVVQASMGAVLRLELQKVPLRQLTNQECTVVAADMQGKNLYEWKPTRHTLLLLGNEGNGISVSHMPYIRERVTIPRPSGSGAESLNVATAAAIILSEWTRK